MSDKESMQGSEGEHNMKVLKAEMRYGTTLQSDDEEALLIENKNIYTPLRLLIKKQVSNPNRPPLPITLSDKLAFFRSYCTTPSKSLFICRRSNVVHQIVYMGVLANTLVACISMFYIEIFLSDFASSHHMFVMEMMPLAWGIWAMYLFTSILELTRFTDIIMVFIDYFILGLYNQLPWNTCSYSQGPGAKFVTYENKQYQYECMTLARFTAVTKNALAAIYITNDTFSCYISETTGTCNQISQIAYMTKRMQELNSLPFVIVGYCVLVWTGCVIWNKHLHKTLLFKTLSVAQLVFNLCYFIAWVFIKFFANTKEVPLKKIIEFEPDQRKKWMLWDLTQFMIGSMSISPPILHFLSARSDKIKPSSDSFLIALGNAIQIFYRASINKMVNRNVDNMLHGFPVEVKNSCFTYPCLYYWLIFFASRKLGNLYTLIFLLINIFIEWVTMIITFQSVIEIYVSEFHHATRWITTSIFCALGITMYMNVYDERQVLSVLCKVVVLLLNCLAIYAFYPLRRLLDDLMFHYGVHPPKIRYFSILFIPATILLIIISTVMHVHLDLDSPLISSMKVYILLTSFMGLPLFGGFIFTFVRYLHWNRKRWTKMFCPADIWGPDNFIARQLRKQFDSHLFIESQAPKILSRYLMTNAEPDAYKLDIVYEQSSLLPTTGHDYIKKKID